MSGVTNMRGGLDSINRLKRAIADLPLRVRAAVAEDAVGVLNLEIKAAFDAGQTVYDTPRPRSVAKAHPGAALSLEKTGKTRGELAFVRVGTILRAQLGSKYGRYLIRYGVLPQRLPARWSQKLTDLVDEYRADFERENAS